MTLKINDSGTWKEPIKVSVKDGGAWKEVLTASVKDGGSWKPFYQRKFTYTVSSNVNKLDLDTVLTADNKLGDVDVVINSGVYVYSDDTSTPALLTGNGVAGTLTIINNGYIYGAGGSGGSGGGSAANGSAGGNGGTALKLEKILLQTTMAQSSVEAEAEEEAVVQLMTKVSLTVTTLEVEEAVEVNPLALLVQETLLVVALVVSHNLLMVEQEL